MADTRVLVVDDSLTMRALISRVLETLPGIEVVGVANGAAEAREETVRLRPDVITLDIEMPGMSGIEYLAEVMEKKPMPVVMFSTRTEAGAASSIEALRLGAIDCFPKPKAASQTEFDDILAKLGNRLRTAKLTAVKASQRAAADDRPFDWNGRMVAIGVDSSGTQKLFDLLGAMPANCPPTIVVQHIAPDLSESMIAALNKHAAPEVLMVSDMTPLLPGKVYISKPGAAHVGVDKWPGGQMRTTPRDPIAGERPSISLLFASLAKAAGKDAIGIILTETGEDGLIGLNAIAKAGGATIAPSGFLSEGVGNADYVFQTGSDARGLEWPDFATTVLGLCRA